MTVVIDSPSKVHHGKGLDMKTVKRFAYLLIGVATVLCLMFAIAAAGTPQENEAKSDKNQDKVRLVASLEGPDLFRSYCASCHGLDGNSQVPDYPKLGGQHPDYLAKAIKDYQTGARKNPIMKGGAVDGRD